MGKLVLLAICKAQTLCLGSAPSLPVLHRELEGNNRVQKKDWTWQIQTSICLTLAESFHYYRIVIHYVNYGLSKVCQIIFVMKTSSIIFRTILGSQQVQLNILFNWPKFDMRLFFDLPVFTGFFHDVLRKLFCRSKQNNFMRISCKNW